MKYLIFLFLIIFSFAAFAANKNKKPHAEKSPQKLDLTIGESYFNESDDYDTMIYSDFEDYKLKQDEDLLKVEPEFNIIGDPTYSGKEDVKKTKEFKLKFKYGF